MERPSLPFADAIREARAEAESCRDAQLLAQHAKTALVALSTLETQLNDGVPLPDPLPGEEVTARAASRWPELAELPALSPRSDSDPSRLQQRRRQLEVLLETLEPLKARAEEVAKRLHHLQHQQRDALEQPAWSDVVAQLRVWADEREHAAREMVPLQRALASLEPIRKMLAAFHPSLQAELIAASRTDDPDGALAWRVATMAREQLVSLAHTIEQAQVMVRYPFEPMVPDQPHPRHRQRLRREAGAVLAWMASLADDLDGRAAVLKDRLGALEERHRRAEAALLEWMG